jgi:hypothetical protein
MKLTITEVAVHREDQSPIFGELTTIVKLMDEGGGPFVTIGQDEHIIRLDFNEVEWVGKAIMMLHKQVKESL